MEATIALAERDDRQWRLRMAARVCGRRRKEEREKRKTGKIERINKENQIQGHGRHEV